MYIERIAQWEPYEAEVEYYYENVDDKLELDLVDALDCSVQQSANKALVWALGPFTGHFQDYARQQGWQSLIPPASNDAPL